MAILTAARWSCFGILVCMSLIISDFVHHFMCFFKNSVSSICLFLLLDEKLYPLFKDFFWNTYLWKFFRTNIFIGQLFWWMQVLEAVVFKLLLQKADTRWRHFFAARLCLLWQTEPQGKSWLNEDLGIRSHHFMGDRWGNSGNSDRLYFFGLQNHCRWWLQPWN